MPATNKAAKTTSKKSPAKAASKKATSGGSKTAGGKKAAVANAPTGFAFFDFDNTIIHGDAGPLFGKHLYDMLQADHNRLRLWLRYVPYTAGMVLQAALYKVGARRRSGIIRSAYKGLRGVPAELFLSEIDDFVDDEIPQRVYPKIVAEIKRHQKAGRLCIIITTGMQRLVERSLMHLPKGIEAVGCKLEIKRGKLTGRVEGPLYGADKANIMLTYCRAVGVDPLKCWAYTDHWSDKHMLEAVGHGVTVNPRGKLRDAAVEQGWTILDLDDPSAS